MLPPNESTVLGNTSHTEPDNTYHSKKHSILSCYMPFHVWFYLLRPYSFSGNNAIAKIKTKFSSKGNENKDFKVVTTILNNEGQEVSKNEQNINLLANTTCQENVQELTVENVHRWNGTKDPYLYTVKVELKDMEENVYDSQTQKVGFRTFKVKDGNFYLNGKLYKLNGVGMHQDREGYGNATY